MQCKIHFMYGFHKSCDRTFYTRIATEIWFMLMLVLSVLQAWASDARDVPRNPHTRGFSHLPRELPPALAGQTEPSPSSWEVWSPSTSYSRAGNAQSLEEQKSFTLWLKLLTNASLKKMTLILSYTLMLPGREKGGALSSKVYKIFMLDTQSSVSLHLQLDPLTYSWHTQSVKILRMEFLPALGQPRKEHEISKIGLLLQRG